MATITVHIALETLNVEHLSQVHLTRHKVQDVSYTEEELKNMYDSTSGRCHLCGEKIDFDAYPTEWEVDHSRPRSKGGTEHGNNLYPAHKSCNRARQNRLASVIRDQNGLSKPPLSRKQRKKKKKDKALTWGGLAAIAGVLLGGPPGAVAAGAIGAVAGHEQDPDE